MKTRKILVPPFFILCSFLFVNSTCLCASVNPEPRKGGRIPIISLPAPRGSEEKIYLGLSSGDGFFKIHQIQAQVILMKIFNLYCPMCQSTASTLVELHSQIENHPDLNGKIRLIGIGAGNSQPQIEAFKQNNSVPFPLFPDPNFSIHKALGEVPTPFFIAIKMNKNGSHEIVYTRLGSLTDIGGLLDSMVEACGIPQEDLQKREKLATSTADLAAPSSELG